MKTVKYIDTEKTLLDIVKKSKEIHVTATVHAVLKLKKIDRKTITQREYNTVANYVSKTLNQMEIEGRLKSKQVKHDYRPIPMRVYSVA